MPSTGVRVTVVQYAGDFRQAAERLARDGVETYRGQRYTVGCIEQLATRVDAVTTITACTDEPYDVVLPSGVRAIGAGFTQGVNGAEIIRLLERSAPNRVILRFPFRPVLRWVLRRRCRTLVLIANSFDPDSFRARVSNFVLAQLLRAPVFEWVANHGLKASEQLVAAGISPRKVLPWDLPALDTPEGRSPKVRAEHRRVLYVGLMVPAKGVDDLIEAAEILHAAGRSVQVDLVGKADNGRIADLITRRGMTGIVNQVGTLPNGEIVAHMRGADIVVVPSRHEYPEGMPFTISEALCSRTPLVVSDHPMFLGNLVHEDSALVFPAGRPDRLAAEMGRLLDESPLYKRISEGGLPAWQRLQVPLKWAALIDDWIEDSPASRARLASHALERARGPSGPGRHA